MGAVKSEFDRYMLELQAKARANPGEGEAEEDPFLVTADEKLSGFMERAVSRHLPMEGESAEVDLLEMMEDLGLSAGDGIEKVALYLSKVPRR